MLKFHSSNVPGSKQYALRTVRALPYAYINVSDHCQYAARSSTGSISNRLAFTLEFSLSQLLRQILDIAADTDAHCWCMYGLLMLAWAYSYWQLHLSRQQLLKVELLCRQNQK